MERCIVDIELVGLGDRGMTALRLLMQLAECLPLRVVALRDTDAARVDAARSVLGGLPAETAASAASPSVPLTYICTDWASHAPLAIEAMRAGRHVAIEVPAALTLDDIRALVATAEQTGRHCFMLENCCYDPAILDAIRRIRNGEIGTPIHAEGTYYHTLGDRWTPWRLDMNRRHRGDLYPTHEFAPICMALGIGRTDNIETLVSMDTAPFTGPALYEKHLGRPAPDFHNGDHTTTIMRTVAGRTIILRHDVLTAHDYDRLFHIVGTHGTITVRDDGTASHSPLTRRMLESLITALAEGRTPDFDVYDMAIWCAVTPLSAISIERGFMPVPFPVFRP